MTRAAIAFMSGPAMKLNSPSFFAAVTIASMVAARTPESAGASSKNAGRQRDRIFFKFRLVEQIFVGHEPGGLVFRRVAHDADGIASFLDRLDRFAIQTAQEDHALVRRAEVLGRAVVDRPLDRKSTRLNSSH